jgi:hypothetical protein
MDNQASRYPYRVFISYSHKDRDLVERMAEILQSIGLQPLWDRDIHPGTPFTDQIKDLIARAHLFIPLITSNSQERPWVHQETGYAQAINIPILPIALEGQGLPGDMIAQLQAVTVRPGLEDFIEQLAEVNLDRLVLPAPRRPHAIIDVADWPETRAELMGQNIQWVTDLGVCGRVRHRAASTTFSIPDREINDPIWKARDGFYDGTPPRSDYFYHLQLEERRALERHARQCGCSLMMGDPEIIGESRGPMGRRVRLESLLEFFDRMTDDSLRIIFLPQRETGNIVMVGDYFVAESVVGRTGGWLQTVFNSHPPTVLQRVRKFDQEFEELYPRYGKSRPDAINEIRRVLDTLPPFPF